MGMRQIEGVRQSVTAQVRLDVDQLVEDLSWRAWSPLLTGTLHGAHHSDGSSPHAWASACPRGNVVQLAGEDRRSRRRSDIGQRTPRRRRVRDRRRQGHQPDHHARVQGHAQHRGGSAGRAAVFARREIERREGRFREAVAADAVASGASFPRVASIRSSASA